MTDDLRVLDDLERRFIATYYGGGVRQPALRGWLPSGAALAAVLAVLAVAAPQRHRGTAEMDVKAGDS